MDTFHAHCYCMAKVTDILCLKLCQHSAKIMKLAEENYCFNSLTTFNKLSIHVHSASVVILVPQNAPAECVPLFDLVTSLFILVEECTWSIIVAIMYATTLYYNDANEM